MTALVPATVSKTTKIARQLRKAAMGKLIASLPSTPHPSLKGHKLAPTGDLFEIRCMTLHKFRHLYDHLVPIAVQRDHLRRIAMGEVGYLLEMHLTHVQFVLVVNPDTGNPELADGNTRSSLYFLEENQNVMPSHVSVLILYPDTKEMSDDVYFCIDSQVNSKRTRHDISSYLRDAGVTLNELEDSEEARLVRDGYLVSAFKRLARVYGIGAVTGKNARLNLKKVTERVIPELQWLSRFNLRPKELNQGVVGAVLWLKSQMGDEVEVLEKFLEGIRFMSGGTAIASHVVVREYFAELGDMFTAKGKSYGTEGAQDVVFALTYECFMEYLKANAAASAAAERKRLTAAASKLMPLPVHFVDKLRKASR